MTQNNGLRTVTTSSRSAFLSCQRYWQWRYEEGYEPRFPTADALWFGTGVHVALARWYRKGKRRGQHPAKTWRQWAADEIAYVRMLVEEEGEEFYDEPKYVDAIELGTVMLEGYVDEYGRDPQWDIIHIEHPFKITVRLKGKPIANFSSTWDGVFRDETDGRIYLLENKTASQISVVYLELDNQHGIYATVASEYLRAKGILKPGEEIAGVQYNFLRKAMPDLRERNEKGEYLNLNGTVSKKQPPPLFVRPDPFELSTREKKSHLLRLTNEVAQMNAISDGLFESTKHTTRDCPRCMFFNACILHERGGNGYRRMLEAEFVQDNPFRQYSKSSGGGG